MAINLQHLLYLIDTSGGDSDDIKEAKVRLGSTDPRDRQLVEQFLTEHGVDLDALKRDWDAMSGRTVHVWTVPGLAKLDAAGVLRKASLRPNGIAWLTVKNGASKANWDRVLKARVNDGALEGVVRLVAEHGYVYEDDRKYVKTTYDVVVRVEFQRNLPIVEAYGSYQDARKALFCFLEWALATPVPTRKSSVQESMLTALSFTEADIRRLATKHKLENVSLKGPDPTGAVGERQLWGHQSGTRRAPLNVTESIVASQRATMNREHWYNFRHRHADGFDEWTEVSFDFAAKQSKITFRKTTSRPACRMLLGHVYDTLKIN